jgi:hypothetical protein
MSRFDSLLKKLDQLTEQSNISSEDETTYRENEPRNLLAEAVNPYLKDTGLHAFQIPKVSVADRKEFMNRLADPENMASSFGIGSLAKSDKFKELAKKFGGTNLEVPKLNEGLSKRISDAFEAMKHDPNNPEVQQAYEALINETLKQYDDLTKAGIKAKKIVGENPYSNSKDLIEKVRQSDEISYFPTDEGFGSGNITNNPMLRKTGRLNAQGEEMLANDVFRVVHDIYGHVKPQSTFGKVGEEVAYQNHKQMFSPLAQKALATETRGQNSYVNFGPNAAHNKANPANTIFAEQKVGLLPDWAINENSAKAAREPLPVALGTGLSNSANDQLKLDALKRLIEGNE